uniref:Uncharacterized protein n=1 Tax=Plectus sambesii TaxID=2011161 RepID=A0A914X9G6_9BILA
MALQIFACLCVIILIIGTESANEFKVYKELTRSYDKNIRPIHNTSLPTYVSVHMTYFTLLNIDQPAETISFMTEVVLSWFDEIVKWNKTAYANIESVVIPASLLWKPDIIVSTSLKTDFMMPEEERFVKVSGDGTVQSASPCIITNQCVLDIQKFPYDVQECNITFGSWMYDSGKIDLKIGNYSEDEVNAADRQGNGEWTLLSMKPTVNHYYSGDGRNWAEVTYVVRLKRQPIYYTCVLLMPTFLSATICLLGLFVPASSKGERIEKVNMGLATLLSMAMILGIVAEEMPKTTTLPLLGYYVLAELILCTIGVILSMLIMLVHQRALTRMWSPPQWMNSVLLFKFNDIKTAEKTPVHVFPAENKSVGKGENESDSVKTIRVVTGYERLREVMERVQECIDDKHLEEDIELQWIIIFDRVDIYLLIVFNFVNIVMSWLLLFN